MLIHTTIALILCATLALTSPVNETQTDGLSKDNRSAFSLEHLRNTSRPVSTTLSPNNINKHVNNGSFPLLAEGGPIFQGDSDESSRHLSKSPNKVETPRTSVEQPGYEDVSEYSKTKLPKIRNASVVARKGVLPASKITARKGVVLDIPMVESTTEGVQVTVGQAKSRGKNRENKIDPLDQSAAKDVGAITEKTTLSEHTNVTTSPNGTKTIASSVASNIMKNSTKLLTAIDVVSTVATKLAANSTITASKPSAKKFKPKPTVTIGEMEADKPIPASPTKTPPLGMPRKIDYIIPVIITIMALPLLGGATFLLYRRGRDCWDKRHYRRMDFLIDGMYNDYSWK